MKITVCIGSSCHLKGSRQVVSELQRLIAQNSLNNQVEVAGTFCMGKRQLGVCGSVDEHFHSVPPETVEEFFNKEVLVKFR